jgi:hypothetical protein
MHTSTLLLTVSSPTDTEETHEALIAVPVLTFSKELAG